MFNITAENDISFKLNLMRDAVHFPVENSSDVVVSVVSSKTKRAIAHTIDFDGLIYIDVDSAGLGTGCYGIEVVGKLNGAKWRSYHDSVWQYTYATRSGVVVSDDSESDYYDIIMEVQLYVSDVEGAIREHNLNEASHPYILGLFENYATQQELAQKQDVIQDLEAIRSGAAKGATAYQKPVGGIPKSDCDSYIQEELYYAVDARARIYEDVLPLIPAQASEQNKLADKDFVNSSVATNTANYISYNGQPFPSLAQLQAYSGPLTNNDYAFVVGTDAAGNTTYTRYKYNADTQAWAAEYVLNNSSFTAAQWAAISSGITSGDVEKLRALPTKEQLDTLFGDINGTLEDHATAINQKANKTNVLQVEFEAASGLHDVCMLQPNEIAEVSFVDYMDFGFDGLDNTQKCEYCIKFNVGATIPSISITGVEWSEALTLEQNKHYVILINYENGALYGDWKSYNIASV